MKKITVMMAALGLFVVLGGSLVLADKIVVVPVVPAYPPQWTAIPDVPGVAYAPNIGQDLFRYQDAFYNYQGGAWFRAPAVTGPWVAVPQPPQVFYAIQAPYFKVPPGWAKGKKTGWNGEPAPPGQMKKYDGGYGPPGHGKKKFK